MNKFLIPRRKVIELSLLPLFLGIFFFFYPHSEGLVLFAFGFIWNWAASNDLEKLFENKRYRLSMLKLVVNLQNLILKPVGNAPSLVKSFLKIFPAGIFWSMVIFLNESSMPWWTTFVGSFVFELMQIEIGLFKRHKEDKT